MSAPLALCWTGTAFAPITARFLKEAADRYGEGEVVTFAEVQDRSRSSHDHYFAAINEAWQNLPESMAGEYPTAEHLRKAALIRAGYRDERSIVCASRAEALRVAAFIKPMDDYAFVVASEAVVRVYTAKSQSMKAMGKQAFQKSKADTLEALADMIGVTSQALHENAGMAA